MKCPYCGACQSRVVDSRQNDDGLSIRRRRECETCARRFTTYERVEIVPLIVVKKDGARETFDASKLRTGMLRACQKRPVSIEQIDETVSRIERSLSNRVENEVSSSEIGELVMEELRKLDEVSYVRFASVYRQFKDIQTFRDELNKLLAGYDMGTTDGSSDR